MEVVFADDVCCILSAVLETQVLSLCWEDPPEEETATHSYSCLGDPIERSLAGYSPWGRKESDTTEYVLIVPMFCHSLPLPLKVKK